MRIQVSQERFVAGLDGWDSDLIDAKRREAKLAGGAALDDVTSPSPVLEDFPDERLKLLFVCAHL